MAYNTNVYFMIFLPLAMTFYQVLPKRYRYVGLLMESMIFFWLISKVLILWIGITAGVAYITGRVMENALEQKKNTKGLLWLGLLPVIGTLVGLKYMGFSSALAPIGISFYTLQAVGYLLDVYWKRIPAERNPLKLLLFLIFFPTLMEGPICRYSDVEEQLFKGEPITADSMIAGSIRMGWGLFKRMIIADRLYGAVNILYKPSANYTGIMAFLAMVITTIQLYMEFSGTIDIVIGTARVFQIRLPENFRQPFWAKSAAEFWRRWHISLGTWFKNYIFYPVSTSKVMKKWNKFGKKYVGKYWTSVVTSAIALFPVWMLNGIWHGPKIPYIMYGVYYFVILLAEVMLEPAGKKAWHALGLAESSTVVIWVRRLRTWLVILVGEVLFRAESLSQFGKMMKNLFVGPWDGGMLSGSVFEIGLDLGDYVVVVLGCIVVFAMEARLEKDPDAFEKIPTLPRAGRWALYYSLILSIVIFGAYGAGYQPAELIYAGF